MPAARTEIDRQAAAQLVFVERRAAGDEDVHFELYRLVDQIGARPLPHRAAERLRVEIEIGRQRQDQWGDMRGLQRRDDVDIERGPRLAGEGARDRPADRVCHAEGVERGCHRQRDGDRIDRRRHRRSRVTISGIGLARELRPERHDRQSKELFARCCQGISLTDAGARQVENGLGQPRDDSGLVGRRHPPPAVDLDPLRVARGVQAERRVLHAPIIARRQAAPAAAPCRRTRGCAIRTEWSRARRSAIRRASRPTPCTISDDSA